MDISSKNNKTLIIIKKERCEDFFLASLFFMITATSCPTDRGDRLKAVRRLMCQLLCRSISMMLQACLLLQQLPLLQEVIHIPFSYSLLFFCYIFYPLPLGRGCLYCPHVLGGRKACLGGGCRLRFFCMGGLTPPLHFLFILLPCCRGAVACDWGVNPYIYILNVTLRMSPFRHPARHNLRLCYSRLTAGDNL